jgi:superfamily I DNA/RNA helicase
MLVALTRAKKRIYFINTIGKSISNFIESIDPEDLKTEEIQAKKKKKD